MLWISNTVVLKIIDVYKNTAEGIAPAVFVFFILFY